MTNLQPNTPTDTTRPAHLIVTADRQPGAHVTDSDDIWWWLPVLGPTATVLAYDLARYARHAEVTWAADELVWPTRASPAHHQATAPPRAAPVALSPRSCSGCPCS
jgi:hypothetical protein